MTPRLLPAVMLSIIVVTTGCFYLPQGDEVSISIYGHDDGAGSGVALSPITTSDSEFSMDGYFSTGGGAANRDVYREVSLRLYSKNGRLLCVERLGDWNVNRSKNASVSASQIPYYVIVYSPDFWNEPMTVEYFAYDEEAEEYRPHDAAAPDELPVTVSKGETAAC